MTDRRLLWRLRSALLVAGEPWELVRGLDLAALTREARELVRAKTLA